LLPLAPITVGFVIAGTPLKPSLPVVLPNNIDVAAVGAMVTALADIPAPSVRVQPDGGGVSI
jgi:hypothetical protein